MRRATRSVLNAGLTAGVVASIALLALAGSGCSSCKGGAGGGSGDAARDDLSLLPKETNVVLSLNLKRLRPTPVWKRITDMSDQTPEQKAKYDDFVKQTGIDPLKQVDALLIALPTTASAGDFGALLRGGPFDEQKLVDYVKSQAKNDGGEVIQNEYNGHKRYTDGRAGSTFAFFLDKGTIGFGNDAWSKKMIDLAGKAQGVESALANAELMALVKKTRTSDALWGAGLIAPEARQRLSQNDQLKSAASMKDIHLSADLTGGFTFDSVIDLGSEADAADLTARLKEQLASSRQNPQIQILGFGRYFDAIKVASQGAALHIDIKLDQAGVDDLIERARGLFKSLGGGGLGGGGGGGADIPMPSTPSAPSSPMAPPTPMPAPQAPAAPAQPSK